MKKIILITLLVIFGCGVFGVVTSYFSYNNKEVSLRAQAEAQRGKVEGVHDKMWKIIQQKAQVTDEYKDAFAEIYPNIISGRYQGENDGALMKWVTEQNPNFDTSLYKDLMELNFKEIKNKCLILFVNTLHCVLLTLESGLFQMFPKLSILLFLQQSLRLLWKQDLMMILNCFKYGIFCIHNSFYYCINSFSLF